MRTSGLHFSMLILSVLAGACAYPVRATSLVPVNDGADMGAPGTVYRLRFVSAVIPPRQRSGLAWDENDGKPDPYVRVLRDGAVVWTGAPEQDTIAPEFKSQMPENFELRPDQQLRIELWDNDGMTSDPIGMYAHRGLPSELLPGSENRILLEGKASLSIVLERPVGQRGLGIAKYEVHDSALVVITVHPHSPAGRAGIVSGDRIVGIDGRAVEDLGQKGSVTALSQAGMKRGKLTIERDGEHVSVEIDGGLTWVVL